MKRLIQALLLLLALLNTCPHTSFGTAQTIDNDSGAKTWAALRQTSNRWDEAVPLGNGIVGTLVWKKGDNLRLTLDRADLWDLRPVKEFSGPNYTYKFVCDAVANKNMKPVYEMIDARTGKDTAPPRFQQVPLSFPLPNWAK